MTDVASPLPGPLAPAAIRRPKLDHRSKPLSILGFFAVLGCGVLFIAYNLYVDVDETGARTTTLLPFLLLFVALLIALGFEFVNGFHDTANAVATAIYTHALPANVAVVWSGVFNFLGVMASSGAVAFGIISLLPVELILQVGSGAGFAMVFALLCAAIIWNLGTWYLGLPASSSHTLIGSIIGVGVAHSMLPGQNGTAGVDWTQDTEIRYAPLPCPDQGSGHRLRSAAVADRGLRQCRPVVPHRQAAGAQSRTLSRADREPATPVDPRRAYRHLHRCLLRARLERRPEGHGTDHADPGRHGAHRLCAEPRHAGQRSRDLPQHLDRGSRACRGEIGRCSDTGNRRAPDPVELCGLQSTQRCHLWRA